MRYFILSLSCLLSLALQASAQPALSGSSSEDAAKKAEQERKNRADDRTDQLVEIYLEAGGRALSQGFNEDASTLLHRALRVADDGGLERLSVARVLDNLARMAEADHKLDKVDHELDQAEEYLKRSAALCEKVVGKDSTTTLTSREGLAAFYGRIKKYDQMEAVLRGSLKNVWKDAKGSTPAQQPRTVVPILEQLAEAYRLEKKYKEAEDTYKNLLYQIKELDGLETPLMVLALNNVADLYREEEKHTEAETYLESAATIMDKALAQGDPTRPVILRALAGVKQVLGKTTDAEALHRQVFDLANASGKKELRAMALLELGSFYHNKPDDVQAEKCYADALKILENDFESRNLAMALVAAAECRLGLGRIDVAAADLNRAQTMVEHLDGKEHEAMAQVLRVQGKCLLAQGKYADAEKALKEARTISTKTSGPDDLTVGYTLELLGKVYAAQDNLAEANNCFQKATEIEEKFSKVAPLRLAESLEEYSRLLQKMQRNDDAGKQAKRAADLRAAIQQR